MAVSVPPIVTNLLKVIAAPTLITELIVVPIPTEVVPIEVIVKLLNPGAVKVSKILSPETLFT